MGEALITRRGGSGGLSANSAVIHVKISAGSTITFSKGGVVVKVLGPEKSHINSADSTFADWYYPVSPSNYGSWTVTATLGSSSKSATITVNSNKVYDVLLTYRNYLIQNGVSKVTFTAKRSASVGVSGTKVHIYTTANDSGGAQTSADVRAYSTLNVEIASGSLSYVGTYQPAFGVSRSAPSFSQDSVSNVTAATTFTGTTTDKHRTITAKTFTLDISSFDETMYIWLSVGGWVAQQGHLYIPNMWLE